MRFVAHSRAVDKIARLAEDPQDLVSFWRRSAGVVAEVVRDSWTPCWLTVDPASLLVTGHFHEELAAVPPRWLAAEYQDDGAQRISDVLRSREGVATLHETTGGDPASTLRWSVNMEAGADQEMLTRLGLPTGEVWGALGLYREPGKALFNDNDKGFVAAAAPYLAEGTRRALLREQTKQTKQTTDLARPGTPGLIILSEDWRVLSATPGAESWLADLPGGDPKAGELPAAVTAVAAHALYAARNPGRSRGPASSRVLTRSGNWAVLHGSFLEDGGERRVAVIVESARPDEVLPVLMSAYQLTAREREITTLVLSAATTADIAEALFISPHTVQQHMKSIFAKTGVRSRRDLLAKMFFSHREHTG